MQKTPSFEIELPIPPPQVGKMGILLAIIWIPYSLSLERLKDSIDPKDPKELKTWNHGWPYVCTATEENENSIFCLQASFLTVENEIDIFQWVFWVNDRKDQKDPKDPKDPKNPEDLKDLKELLAIKDPKDLKDPKEPED